MTTMNILLLLLFASFVFVANANEQIEKDASHRLIVVTVASSSNDGFQRFNRSINEYEHELQVLGFGEPWKGGLMDHPGGGYKVNLLAKFLREYKDEENVIILFVDSYDLMILSSKELILDKFFKFEAKVLFSAESFCWPDKSLAKVYPQIGNSGNRYLNSGGIIGYSNTLYEIVNAAPIKNKDDDQLYYTKLYIDSSLRNKWSLKLDHKCKIFQNLHGAEGVELRFNQEGEAFIYNNLFQTDPLIVHGNGLSKTTLNSLGNYLANSWSTKKGCVICNEHTISLNKIQPLDAPLILVGIFIEHPTAFLSEFFENLLNLRYPKQRMTILLHNKIEFHQDLVDTFLAENSNKYGNFVQLSSDISEFSARTEVLEKCRLIDCGYYLSIDSDAHLTNRDTLITLIQQNRKIIAPLITRQDKLWSNFWGALSSDGFYARSHDYIAILNRNRKGVWNVPYISQIYLINGTLLKTQDENDISYSGITFYDSTDNADMKFCESLRNNNIFMYLTNVEYFGHLVNSETFDISLKNPDLYEIYSNKFDWENRYIHENYTKILKDDYILEQPCPDVYWFPLVTTKFTQDLIEIMENFGKWSGGTNEDVRLSGGYENVPTRDIHMNQVGFEQHWLYFLREYIRPVQERIFTGYFHDPPKAIMNFVVRYNPQEQPSLRPHHDSSTYTINIALNKREIDYTGGGCRFIRYNCSVVDLRVGWSLIHPGRLTHYHEGLPVKSGTRYIMVSFVDP